MLKYLFTVLAALTAGVSMAFTPVVYTNSFERDGVTYVQRGGLGTKDYVVTNVSMPTITYPVTSVNSKTGDVILAASDVSALPDNYTSLTNSTNFTAAVAQVSPPVDVSYKADAEVKYNAYEYRFSVTSGGNLFQVWIGLQEAVAQNFSGNHLIYARVSKNGVAWVISSLPPLGNWLTLNDSGSSDYVMLRKDASGWEVRVSTPYSRQTGYEPEHSIVTAYKTVAESVANLVPNTRTVNGQPLSANVSITTDSIGAVSKTGGEEKMYAQKYTLSVESQSGNINEVTLFNDRIWLKDTTNGVTSTFVIRNWDDATLSGAEGAAFETQTTLGHATFLIPKRGSNQEPVYHFALDEEVSRDYSTKVEAASTATNAVNYGISNYKGQYIWSASADRRVDNDGNLYYQRWNLGNAISWVNEQTGETLTYDSANKWSGQTDLGNTTLVYNESTGLYYIQQFPICRYEETLKRETAINLSVLGKFKAVKSSPYHEPIEWATYGKFINNAIYGNEKNAKATADWWFRQGVKWNIDDNELLWDGDKWKYVDGNDIYTVSFKTQPSDSDGGDKVVFTYKTVVGGVTNSVDSASVDYRFADSWGAYIMFGTTYAYALRMRNVQPKDYTVPDWARAAMPPESMDYEAVTNISTYVATNQGFALAANVVPNTRTVNGQPLTSDITIETPTDYEAITNTVNAVKAQFYDEPLQVNWTLKMVNGEMKLYATTNVNMSTL